VTDSVDQLADAQGAGVPNRDDRQVAGSFSDAEQREVKVPAALGNFSIEGSSVAQDDLDPRASPPTCDDVVVRQHEAIFGPDHTRPGTATPAPHLHNALVGVPDHLRARR
jgi:hypothetical protein